MDTLHTVLRAIRTEGKSHKDDVNVFREFLARLEELQRRGPQPGRAPRNAAARMKPVRRGK